MADNDKSRDASSAQSRTQGLTLDTNIQTFSLPSFTSPSMDLDNAPNTALQDLRKKQWATYWGQGSSPGSTVAGVTSPTTRESTYTPTTGTTKPDESNNK